MNIAIIPARAGSKRLPNKNIKELNGKPLIVWTIEAAIESLAFDQIIVSTDSLEIQKIAVKAGAIVPYLRSPELSSDTATTNDVITDIVEYLESIGECIQTVALLQPTSPLRTSTHINKAFKLKKEKNAKAIVSVCEMEFAYQLCNQLKEDHSLDGFVQEKNNKRVQELEPYYRLNGAIYLFDRSYVSNISNLYSPGTYAYIMPVESSVDIDNLIDFELASILLKK